MDMETENGIIKDQKVHEIERPMTDDDVRRKALKSVLMHMRKKLPENFEGLEHFNEWADEFEALLDKEEFDKASFYGARKKLNDIIERTVDGDTRIKLRDSWFSMGKALDKKVKPK
jgi:hypothetical protein